MSEAAVQPPPPSFSDLSLHNNSGDIHINNKEIAGNLADQGASDTAQSLAPAALTHTTRTQTAQLTRNANAPRALNTDRLDRHYEETQGNDAETPPLPNATVGKSGPEVSSVYQAREEALIDDQSQEASSSPATETPSSPVVALVGANNATRV